MIHGWRPTSVAIQPSSFAIKGNGNFALILFAIANVLMFTGFGLMGLGSMYDKYKDEHIPTIKERTKRLKENAKEDKQGETILTNSLDTLNEFDNRYDKMVNNAND